MILNNCQLYIVIHCFEYCHSIHNVFIIVDISSLLNPGINNCVSSNSLTTFSFQASSDGTVEYLHLDFTIVGVNLSGELPFISHSVSSDVIFLPITVLLSDWLRLANNLIDSLELSIQDLWNFTKRLESITFGCMHLDIDSIKYLWVHLGTLEYFWKLTSTC